MNTKIIALLATVATLVAAGVFFLLGQQMGQQKGTDTERARRDASEAKMVAAEKERQDRDHLAIERLTKELEALRLQIQQEEQRKRDEAAKIAQALAEEKRLKDLAAAEAARLKAEQDGRSPYHRVKVVAVGIDYAGSADPQPLKYAERDATEMAKLLGQKYKFEDVTLILGKDATKARIEAEITKTLAGLADDEDFLFYFAGHGISLRDNQLGRCSLLLPYDCGPGAATERSVRRARAIDLADLATQLQKSEKGRHRMAILDACCAALPRIPGVTVRSADTPPDQLNPLQYRTVQIISATGVEEQATELAEAGGGIFTNAVRQRLEKVGDGMLSVDALFKYVYADVRVSPLLRGKSMIVPLPTLRTLVDSEGDFVFVLPEGYPNWNKFLASAEKPAPVRQELDEAEHKRLMAQLGPPPPAPAAASKGGIGGALAGIGSFLGSTTKPDAPPPPAPLKLSDKDRERLEFLGARGDTKALMVLSVYYGRAADPATQKYGLELAQRAYETGDEAGKLSLGLAYYEGFAGQKDEALGAELIGRSGKTDVASWIPSFALMVGGGIALATGKDAGTKIAGGLAVAKGLIDLANLGKTVYGQFNDHLKDARGALAGTKPDMAKAIKEIDAAIKDLTPDKRLDAEGKKPYFATAQAIRKSCTENNPAEAIRLIDQALPKLAFL